MVNLHPQSQNKMITAILKKGKEIAIQRKHPWIFSGAIDVMDPCHSGDLVRVLDSHKQFCALGHVGDGSIAVRILSFEDQEINAQFWESKLLECIDVRTSLGLGFDKQTNAFRLVHGEGDGLPGLIIDIYSKHAVIQTHSDGMYQHLDDISNALNTVFKGELESIYSKSKAALHDTTIEDEFLIGSAESTVALENGMKMKVNWVNGQKTGFFIDQRENRDLLRHYSKGKSVLNTFAYTGGFSVAALIGGATKVVSVDISKVATDLCTENTLLNGVDANHESITADVMQYLTEDTTMYDIVVLDPPAFAKSIKKKHSATMGYKRLNAMGLKRVNKGGLLFTFSCSQVIDETLFLNTVTAAAIEVGRSCRILHRLSQGPDHPVNIFHPEGHYLKGLVLRID
jgi:23S rRNA (cytosine1962-C5)-methyltransferase